MTKLTPRGWATGMGSMPHRDAHAALRAVLENVPAMPFWPQLPCRDFRENMYAQFSQDLPGVKIDRAREWIGAVTGDELLGQVQGFYERYLTQELSAFAIGREYAEGLYAFVEMGPLGAKLIKGQITGPISLGLKITDQNLRPILYDDTLRDVLVKHVTRTAQWHAHLLAPMGPAVTFVDEPSLAMIGASVVALNRDQVMSDLEEVYAGIDGLKGTHCCGNTDWSMLLQTSVDVVSFDAYTYAENLALFAGDVKAFLDRGGVLAWGIVPTTEELIAQETSEHLVARLEHAMGLLVNKGIDRDLIREQALITPACGLGTVSVAAAERALELTAGVSTMWRERCGWID